VSLSTKNLLSNNKIFIRFKNQALTTLRRSLLADLSNEYYAVLLAKRQQTGNITVFTAVETIFPHLKSYKNQDGVFLKVDGNFMACVLNEIDQRIDVDTVIEVHTHPFSKKAVYFSGTDDKDERDFTQYLYRHAPDIHYASIVFSQTEYKARCWEIDESSHPIHYPALIRTQKISEQINSSDDAKVSLEIGEMFQRSVAALGLDNLRKMISGQKISIVGVGGLGSIIAEHLIHLGINDINLIDFDKLELTNLNRIVGAYYQDAVNRRFKVDTIKEHMQRINPQATINTYPLSVFDPSIEQVIAESNWIFMATDNHASRYKIQQLAFQYYVPFITAGVNISVENDFVIDMSGEVILVRMGDAVCLRCLQRVNFNEVAREIHPDKTVREGLVAKGYVRGRDVKEPAVKTLNTHLATLAVDVFINQFTERRRDAVITVYEDNHCPAIYEDMESLEQRNFNCDICGE
jgi:molybdopterin/thiamine biosynthesis adenylyltransferase